MLLRVSRKQLDLVFSEARRCYKAGVREMRTFVIAGLLFAAILACSCKGNKVTGDIVYPPSWPLDYVKAPAGSKQVTASILGSNPLFTDNRSFTGGGGITGTSWAIAIAAPNGIEPIEKHMESSLGPRGWRVTRVAPVQIGYYSSDFLWGVTLTYLESPTADPFCIISVRKFDSSAAHLPQPSKSQPIQ
jgi:hypothetical protein